MKALSVIVDLRKTGWWVYISHTTQTETLPSHTFALELNFQFPHYGLKSKIPTQYLILD
jgi:hypothetical protein